MVVDLRFADALQPLVHPRRGVAELVGLVHDDEIETLGMADLVQAAARDDVDIAELELGDGFLPGIANGGGDDDQGPADVDGKAIVIEEISRDLAGHEGFAESNHVRQEECIRYVSFSEYL